MVFIFRVILVEHYQTKQAFFIPLEHTQHHIAVVLGTRLEIVLNSAHVGNLAVRFSNALYFFVFANASLKLLL